MTYRSYRTFAPKSRPAYLTPVDDSLRVAPSFTGSPQQVAIWDALVTLACHIIVKALAGTGKTSTIIAGLFKLMDAALQSGQSVAFVAFNKSIATELQSKVPVGVVACTLHSLGFKAIQAAFGRVQVNSVQYGKTIDMLPAMLEQSAKNTIGRLVSLCKGSLIDGTDRIALLNLAADYDVDLGDNPDDILRWIPDVLRRSRDNVRVIDFDDMVWLPVVLALPLRKFDVLFVDESQDLNAAQQALVMQAGDRICLVGDENQAIYGFRGADSESMATMAERLTDTPRGLQVFPLTLTRRCAPAIVQAAQEDVPAFETTPELWAEWLGFKARLASGEYAAEVDAARRAEWEGTPEHLGRVCTGGTDKAPCDAHPDKGHMVLCRTNAPLIASAYHLIRQNIPVKIQGRDIGAGLASMIKKLVPADASTVTLLEKLASYRDKETQKIHAANGNGRADAKLQALGDRCDCVEALCEDMDTVGQVLDRVQVLFSDVQKGDASGFVLLSSIHRAKGLEAHTVHVIHPELLPHPMARTPKQIKQEYNLRYVARTRAIRELHYH